MTGSRPRSRARVSRWVEPVIVVALVVVGIASCYLRVPAEHLDIVWAEDGEIFLREYLDEGFLATLFRGYAGYQHLVPRLGAGVAVPLVPLEYYPLAVFAICAVLTGLVGAAVFHLSRDVVPWIPGRIALGLVTFVLPLSLQEVIGNFADLHSYAMWLAPWLLFSRPRTRTAAWLWGVVAFAVVMTEVQAVIYLLLLPFVVRRRDPRLFPIAGGFLLGGAWQIMTALTVDRGSDSRWFGVPSLVEGYLINTVLPMLVASPDSVRGHLASSGFIIPLVILLFFFVALVITLVWGTPRQRLLALTLLVVSVAIYVGGVTVDGNEGFHYADDSLPLWDRAVNIRYGVSSGMLLAALVPLGAAVLHTRSARAARGRILMRVLAWSAVTGLIVVMVFASTRAVSTRGWVTANWSYSIGQARESCERSPADATQVIPIAPVREIELTCAELEE